MATCNKIIQEKQKSLLNFVFLSEKGIQMMDEERTDRDFPPKVLVP